VPLVRVLRPVYCWGGGWGSQWVVWSVGLYEGVEDCVREYGLRVVKTVACSKLSMDVASMVLRWAPFLWHCTTCMILFMGPDEWGFSSRCLAKLEV